MQDKCKEDKRAKTVRLPTEQLSATDYLLCVQITKTVKIFSH